MFQKFSQAVDHITLPKRFTYPFYYQPHPLAEIAAHELQLKLTDSGQIQGRMYGVLVVKNTKGMLGYLAAVSGTEFTYSAKDKNCSLYLVPPIFGGFNVGSEYQVKQLEVNKINQEIENISISTDYLYLKQLNGCEQETAKRQISLCQNKMAERRKERKIKRAELAQWLTEQKRSEAPEKFMQATQISIDLSRQSVADKKQLAVLKAYWRSRQNKVSVELERYQEQLSQLKKRRRNLSNKLQNIWFSQYQLLNILGEEKGLKQIFIEQINAKPSAGSGDCAAPKLLQYAFQNNYKPICMAEFWWGEPARSEVRKHGYFYPSCQGKCQPILGHMLLGLEVDDNPLVIAPKPLAKLDIVFQDNDIAVVNKPAQLLSVPGKYINDSVYTRIKAKYPQASGSLIVHRLDMATSGLLVLALNSRSHKKLQQQFIDKKITKRYIALVDGEVTGQSGEIKLPLIGDILDRPRQKVCYTTGKPAHTRWQVLHRANGKTKLSLTPVTGRTHQLRVHCAHAAGLNMPIIGDGLYGNEDDRLYLQAKSLIFHH